MLAALLTLHPAGTTALLTVRPELACQREDPLLRQHTEAGQRGMSPPPHQQNLFVRLIISKIMAPNRGHSTGRWRAFWGRLRRGKEYMAPSVKVQETSSQALKPSVIICARRRSDSSTAVSSCLCCSYDSCPSWGGFTISAMPSCNPPGHRSEEGD